MCLKTSKGTLERAVQHLYPMELNCNVIQAEIQQLNLEASVFTPRPRRDAAVAARMRVEQFADRDSEGIIV